MKKTSLPRCRNADKGLSLSFLRFEREMLRSRTGAGAKAEASTMLSWGLGDRLTEAMA
jgi:hypothetical protein